MTDTDQLLAKLREEAAWRIPHVRDELNAAIDRLAKIVEAAQVLYDDAGVDDIDQRLDYVMLQVGRDEWNDFVAAVKP